MNKASLYENPQLEEGDLERLEISAEGLIFACYSQKLNPSRGCAIGWDNVFKLWAPNQLLTA